MEPGTLIAQKYRIERPLGQGGMGAVYVAVNERLDKRVALKVLHPELARSADSIARLTREAIAASRARHPGIVEIYDADNTDGVAWIAMELLEGESLGDRVARAPLPPNDAIAIVLQALDALAHVHGQGIVHRDLKPDNLFLAVLPDGTRRVKIVDFGIAASFAPGAERMTAAGMVVGTPAYLAPEQLGSEPELDARVDVYAMGTILFEVLTGRLPYDVASLAQLMHRMMSFGPPRLDAMDPRYPAALADVLAHSLAVSRDARYPSALAMRRALEPFASSLGGMSSDGADPRAHTAPPLAMPAPPVMAPSRASSSRLVVLGCLGLCAAVVSLGVVGTAVYVTTRSHGSAVAPSQVASVAPTAPAASPSPAPPSPSPTSVVPVPVDPVPSEDERASDTVAVAPVVEDPAPRSTRRVHTPRESPREAPREAPRVVDPSVERRADPTPPPAEAPHPIPPDVWNRVLQQHATQLDGCYYGYYTSPPRPSVSTRVTMHVDTSGRVESVAVAGAPTPLARCLERELMRARFPQNPWPSRGTFVMRLFDQ
ncbi:MAG: protein kinase [Sandaracinaceae bacterium]